MSRFRAVCLFTLSSSLILGGLARGAERENRSPIFFDTKESIFLGSIQFCWRSRGKTVPLKEVGITDYDLRRGRSCVVGDFDGNGFLDFAFRGRKRSGGKEIHTLRVLFYHGTDSIRIIDIPGSGFFLYPATDSEGPFGEPRTEFDGLINPGEGGSTFVYLFDLTTQEFRVSEHASEHH